MKWKVLTLSLVSAALAWAGPDPSVARILKQHEAAVPTVKQLAFFSHDWAPDLATAKERAKKENRPIFLVWVTNVTATPSFFSGHC